MPAGVVTQVLTKALLRLGTGRDDARAKMQRVMSTARINRDAEERDLLLVVVGAGASFDCLPDAPLQIFDPLSGDGGLTWNEVRPPVTRDLVLGSGFHNKVLNRYPAAGGLADELRQRLAVNATSETLEQVLSEISARESHDPDTSIRMLALRYYLRDLFFACADYVSAPSLGGVTNYTRLVAQSNAWATANHGRVCFVNFNYDMLLDSACSAGTRYAIGIEPQDPNGVFSLVRPHGSIAWEQRSGEGGSSYSSKRRIAQTVLEDWRVPSVSPVIHVDLTTPDTSALYSVQPSIPVMALPLPAKSEETLVWPDEQRRFFESLAGQASKVVILGWRGVDEHFTPYLARAARQDCALLIVAGGDQEEARKETVRIEQRLVTVGGRHASSAPSAERHITGFSTFMASGHYRNFLDQQ